MENFFSDEEKPVSNKANTSDNKETKKEPNPFKLEMNNKEGQYVPPETSRFESPLTSDERQRVGSYYQSKDPNKLLSDTQKWYEQFGNTAGHVVTNFLGDTISSFGSTYQIGADLVNEVKNKDAEFTNDVIDFGNSIKEWGKTNLPTYRDNPNESWDVKDPAWWFDGIESAFSSLSFLVGGLGAVKGVGALAKLTKAEQLLAKAGANVEKLKLGTKIATSASFARNAENMMESYQVRQDVKKNLLEEWNDDEKFKEIQNSEVGQELSAEGRELSKENLANFIAGKAGWKTYAVNSLNIAFDAIQLAPLFKGFNPSTSISKFATSSKVLEANRKLLNSGARSANVFDKVFDIMNPLVSGIGRSASEGVEEAINYIGTEEGKNLADQLTNKDDSSFSNRLSKYLKSGDLYESAFWGTLGGATFEGATKMINKLQKGYTANDTSDMRIAEISNRLNIIQEGSKKIKDITDSQDLDDSTKASIIANVKAELALDLGLRAAQVGNVDLLTQQVKSKEYRDKIVDLGIANDIDVDKAIAKTISDIHLAEKLYKNHYNSFQTAEGSDFVKSNLINKSVVTDFFIKKNEERKNILNTDLANLKSNDQYIKNSDNKNLESLIYMEGLKTAQASIQEYINKDKKAEDALLTEKGKQELAKIKEKISKIKEQVGEDTLDITAINPDIISKQAEVILMEGVNNIQASKVNEYRKPETIKKEEEKIQKDKEEFEEEVFNNFKDEINKGVKDKTIKSEDLEKIREDNKKDRKKTKFVNDILTEVKTTEESEARKTETTPIVNSPVIEGISEDEFEGLPQFEIDETLDETQVNASWKPSLDQFIKNRDIENITGVTGDLLAQTNPYEVQYVKNKVQQIRNQKVKESEIKQMNTSPPQGINTEFEFDEAAQNITSNRKTLDNFEDESEDSNEVGEEPNPFDFLSKEVIKGKIRTYIPIFGYGLKQYGYKEYFTIRNGNIIVEDEHVATVKSLMNPEFKEGDEIEIVWDEDNKVTKAHPKWKGDINNEAFKILHNGVFISYIPTIATTEYEIEEYKNGRKGLDQAERDHMINKLSLELPYTRDLRKQLSFDKPFKTKLIEKGNGTVISRGTGINKLHSVKGIFNDFYALDPESYLDANKLLNIGDRKDSFDSTNPLVRYVNGNRIPNQGKIYGKLMSANDTPIPVPLTVSKVTLSQAKELQSNIEELLQLLNQGKNTENSDVKEVKDKISKYIKVDRFANYDKPIGFRVFPQGVNKDNGNPTEARIEMSYINEKNERVIAVIRLSTHGSGSYVGLFKDGKKVHETTIENPEFLNILREKYQNVDFSLLTKNEPFGKYPSYKDYLVEEEVIQTDIAQVVDKKGNVISNLFGFDNDFTIAINPTLENSIFQSKEYEHELKAKDTISDKLEYRKDYAIYNNSIVDAATVLKDILKNPQNDNIKEVATWLQSNISKTSLTVQLVDKKTAHGVALYSSEKNSILVSKSRPFSEAYLQQVLLHEMIHGVTVSAMRRSLVLSPSTEALFKREATIDADSIPFKDDAPQYVKDFVIDIVQLRNQAISKLTKKYGKSFQELTKDTSVFYGLENPYEFISEVMTNPNFRNELRKVSSTNNFLTSIYNQIIDFLNKIFSTKINKIEDDILKTSIDTIKNFVDSETTISPLREFDIVNPMRATDKFDNVFSREEILETVNSFEGITLNILKNKNINLQSDELRDLVLGEIRVYTNKEVPDSVKAKADLVSQYSYEFYAEALKRINKSFKISTSFDINRLQENQEVTKEYNDLAAQQVSSQDNVTNQIKMFIKTVPQLSSVNTTSDNEGNTIWDIKKSTMTGMNTFVDFNTIYPYLIRNIIGARSMSDIINRLNNMSKVNPSFAYIANELTKDVNLLSQFESNLAKKYVYDSYVTFISNMENQRDIWTSNELKSTKYDYLIADQWTSNINKIIDNIKTPEDKLEFDKKITRLYLKISKKSKDFKDNIESLTEDIFELSNELGVDLSYSVIKGRIETLRDWNDFEIIKSLHGVAKSINDKKKSDDFKRLNTLAKLEALVKFEIVENSGLDIKGNLIYAIRNPNFISNWFQNAKSDTKEGRQEFEEYLLNLARIPELQFSNWLWNDKTSLGFLNYEIKDGKKVPVMKTPTNWEFVKSFDFHNFGGAKETITRNVQDYTDFSDKDWTMLNLINYIRPDDKTKRTQGKEKDFVLVPSLIPSDSGTMYLFEVAKVKLGKDDVKKGKVVSINPNSKIFNAVLNTARQEVRRIQQATIEVFDIIDNKLVVKKDLDISKLQQYYHYDKELTSDLASSLLNEDGTPKGKAFYFQNMLVQKGDKFITLDDIEGIKINGHLGLGEVSSDVINKIKNFTIDFVNQQISQGISDYRVIQSEVEGKYDNISDGSFENLITEYILNTYIHNTEQFNFFNGNISEYKNKIDTNKRAKQMFAPGIALSIEAMKMKYQNGSYSTGVSFSGITLKDVITTSKTIDFIAESVKKRLVTERPNNYSKLDIEAFNLNGKSKLDKDVFGIIGGYTKINAGDAQGYITLDRYEQILRGLGRFNAEMEAIISKARKGKSLNIKELKALQPIKGFYYGREYDVDLNKLTSNQIKYSSMPLIPQLVKGTELEKLMNYMNANNIEEAFYESAHKIGAKAIYKIDNEDGTINESILKSSKPTTYYNRNWQLQLDVPEYILDEENLLATQIAKLIIANLDATTKYNVNGKDYSSTKLIEHYFSILGDNILESANTLIDDLGIIKQSDGFLVKDRSIQRLLLEEVEKRGLSDNYSFAIEIDNDGNFKLPLFINTMSTKWEAILTSLFTNRIIKQKMPGGSVVLGSRLFLDNKSTQSETNVAGIEWSKEKEAHRTLRSYREEDSKTQVVEVLLGAWSSELYNRGERISIDDVPEEVKIMIGYRIPTQAKHSMIVFKVVGFLPDQNRGLIITPDDLVTQMGSDFDIDKLFLMNKNFYTNDNKEFIIPKLSNEKKEYEDLIKEIQTLYEELYSAESVDKDTSSTRLVEAIFSEFTNLGSAEDAKKDIKQNLNTAQRRLEDMLIKEEATQEYKLKEEGSRQARQNEIFDIYNAILTNPVHSKEIFTPAEFESFKDLKREIEEIFNQSDNSINPLTERGQRTFRKRNIGGRSLKGIAANLNAFGSIAQVTKMELNPSLAFKFKFDLDKYDVNKLRKRYGEDLEVVDNFAVISFSKLGFAPDGSYLNVDDDLILEHASQGIGAAVDIVKDPTFDAFNATTYTYPLFHTMLLSGIPTRLAGMFIRQPILKTLNDYYFENKSLLGDVTGNQIENVKLFYQTQLYVELTNQDKITDKSTDSAKKAYKIYTKRKQNNIVNSYDKRYLIYVKRDDTEKLLGYNPNILDVFDVETLKNQLVLNAAGYNAMSADEKVSYLKTQLQILEYFNTWKKAGEGVQDILQATKTDSIGAGPTMDVTTSLIRTIDRLELNDRVIIDGTPAIQKIYPSHFKRDEKSVYSPLEDYLNHGNKMSVRVLDRLFVNQTRSFKDVVYTINGLNPNLQKNQNYEDTLKAINRFLNVTILQDFNLFKKTNKREVLGVEKPFVRKVDSIDTFKELSTANKIYILKDRQKEYLKGDSQHILNFLTPLLDEQEIKDNGYHKIDFVFYKNEFTDDNLADSIIKMYETGNEFEKDLAESLIKYSFAATGLTFGLQSFSKVIPNQILYNLGLGEYLREVQQYLKDTSMFSTSTVDSLFRNNWNNSQLVPPMRTRWDYLPIETVRSIRDNHKRGVTMIDLVKTFNIGEEAIKYIAKGNNRVIKTDKEDIRLTKDNSPVWNSKQNFLIIPDKSLKTLDEDKDSPYITIPTKEGSIMYKKYIKEDINEEGVLTTKSSFNGNTYYYKVNKLGKDGIYEFTNESMFSENNVELSEAVVISKIEEIINKIEEKRVKDLEIKNTTKAKQEETKERCNYGK